MLKLAGTIDVSNTLGEGPVWDERIDCLWWTDIHASNLFRWDWDSGTTTIIAVPERLCSLGLTDDPAILICAFASGFALLWPGSGRCEWLHKVEPVYRGLRLNDGRVDRQGRFWAGSMVEDATLAGAATGSLYRLDPDGRLFTHFDGIRISNSTCFSPDGTVAYFADTPTGRIDWFALAADGSLGERQVFSDAPIGGPDGSDVDALGRLWNAEWGAYRLSCYDPAGSQAMHFTLPVSRPTCPVFGGPDLRHLFVTSSRLELDAEALAQEPDAGKVFILEAGCQGLPAAKFPLQALPATAGLAAHA